MSDDNLIARIVGGAAAGLMRPITEQDPAEVIGPIVQHLLFGIVTVAIYQWLRERV
jgi:hypothetical protein